MITSKKLKGILKLLAEHRVRFYKDEEVEIEMRSNHDSGFLTERPIEQLVPPLDQAIRELDDQNNSQFNIDAYDKKAETSKVETQADGHGMTDDDYLYWSADN